MPPLTPFLGLSVLAHIGIIVGHKLFSWAWSKKTSPSEVTATIRIVGLLIVATMFTIVITVATILVRESIVERHSTISFISRQVKHLLLSENSRAEDARNAAQISAAVPIPIVSAPDCARFFDALAAFHHRSLYDYMAAQGYNPSLGARRELAASIGISGYQGTSEQNVAMLNYFCQNPLP